MDSPVFASWWYGTYYIVQPKQFFDKINVEIRNSTKVTQKSI